MRLSSSKKNSDTPKKDYSNIRAVKTLALCFLAFIALVFILGVLYRPIEYIFKFGYNLFG